MYIVKLISHGEAEFNWSPQSRSERTSAAAAALAQALAPAATVVLCDVDAPVLFTGHDPMRGELSACWTPVDGF
jgi:hypothetical protein